LDWNRWARQAHRWLSIAFTVAVLVNIVLNITAREQKITLWAGLLTLLPLTLLLFTGLYLFVLPYATKWRRGRRTE
jgi:type II secretory pathway component PulM